MALAEESARICNAVCDSHPQIVGAWIFDSKQEIASCLKPIMPNPQKEEQERMFLQAHIMLAMVNTNAPMYGALNYILVSFQNFDAFLIPLRSSPSTVLAVGCKKPFTVEDVASRIDKIIREISL